VKALPRDALFAAGLVVLILVGLVRVASPDRSRTRPVSVQAIEIASETVAQGQTATREAGWEPPDDVYVIGWAPRAGAPDAEPEMMLRVGDVRLFEVMGAGGAPTFYPAGSGYLLRKGQRLTLRLTLTNSGPAAESRGAHALVYFIPVAGD
jgi:hypothetical protein